MSSTALERNMFISLVGMLRHNGFAITLPKLQMPTEDLAGNFSVGDGHDFKFSIMDNSEIRIEYFQGLERRVLTSYEDFRVSMSERNFSKLVVEFIERVTAERESIQD